MSFTRRDFLKGALAGTAAATLWPGSSVSALMAPPGAGSRNVVFLDLRGGNDGLNTVVPHGLDGGTYLTEFRPTIGVDPGTVLPIDGSIGFHPALAELWAHYDAGRLAVVQGVGYPEPSFSHEMAQRIWQTGDPSGLAVDGWFGRFLAASPPPATPDTVTVSHSSSLMTSGSGGFTPAFKQVESFQFPIDPWHSADGDNRRAAYAAISAGLASDGGDVGAMAGTSGSLLELIDLFATVPEFEHVGSYPEGSLSKSLQLVARLLHADIGMRYFHVPKGGFDTHADQNLDDDHGQRLAEISQGLAALHDDLAAIGLATDTLFVVFSEFGRTVYENGSGGTDHGTVGPVLVLGDGVQGGLTTPHPSMDPADLTEHGELPRVADLRDVFGSLVADWLGGDPAIVFPGHAFSSLPIIA